MKKIAIKSKIYYFVLGQELKPFIQILDDSACPFLELQ
jgi:hypothetical protein